MAGIGNMTLDELKALIDQRISERLSRLFGEFEIDERQFFAGPEDTRSLEDVFESIERNMWTPPPGARSSLELLREDRDR